MSPDGVFPLVRVLVFFNNQFLVDFNTDTGLLGKIHIAVGESEVFFIESVVQNFLTHVVVDSDGLLLDTCVIAGCVNVSAGRKGDGSERTVRCESNVIGLCHGCDLLDFSDSACVA